jgi:hypothetical protein
MKPACLSHIGVITLLLLLPSSAVSAKKKPSKSVALVQLIAPNAERKEAARDAMFIAAFGKAAPVERSIDEQSYSFSPEAIQTLGGDMFALISMGYNVEDGHAQSGMNTIHYLRKTATGYTIVGEWMGMGATGTFGQPALRYALTTKLGKNPYLVTQAGGTWQGYTCENTLLTELMPDKPMERANFDTGYSNSGAMTDRKRQDINGIITAAVPDVSFTVRFTGTRKFTQIWARDAEKYNLKEGYEVPEC